MKPMLVGPVLHFFPNSFKCANVLTVIILLLQSFYSIGQTTATTKEGKEVILYKNGTWKYSKSKSQTKDATPESKSELVATPLPEEKAILNNTLEKESENFALSIVSLYFKNDCENYKSKFDRVILTRESVIEINQDMQAKLCESLTNSISDRSKGMDDYLRSYNYRVMSLENFQAKYNLQLPATFVTKDPQFVFLGFEPKPNVAKTKFIWDDMFCFLVRKVNDEWKIAGYFD